VALDIGSCAPQPRALRPVGRQNRRGVARRGFALLGRMEGDRVRFRVRFRVQVQGFRDEGGDLALMCGLQSRDRWSRRGCGRAPIFHLQSPIPISRRQLASFVSGAIRATRLPAGRAGPPASPCSLRIRLSLHHPANKRMGAASIRPPLKQNPAPVPATGWGTARESKRQSRRASGGEEAEDR